MSALVESPKYANLDLSSSEVADDNDLEVILVELETGTNLEDTQGESELSPYKKLRTSSAPNIITKIDAANSKISQNTDESLLKKQVSFTPVVSRKYVRKSKDGVSDKAAEEKALLKEGPDLNKKKERCLTI